MLSTKQKRIIFQILPFGIVPAIFSAVHVILEKGILGNHPVYPSTGNPFDSNIFVSVVTAFVVGVIIGFLEVFYVNKWFQNRSFYQKIIFKSILYTVAIIIASAITVALGHAVNQNKSPFSSTVWNFVLSFFTNFVFWSIICYYSLAILVSLFYKEVSDNMGHAVSLNFFTGKYHQPKSEFRVFMFLDMKSSTAHAEKLGHIRYFEMLKDYYDDLSHAILKYGGEIYQYVGDEIVITWKVKKDFAKKALDCFFDMKLTLSAKDKSYLSKYGFSPKFKAGLHFGKVTTGEIGRLKKDIVFTGDTLNTTARIQSLCNQYGAELLVSEDFTNAIKSKSHYKIQSLGKVQLRGRNEGIELFRVNKTEHNNLNK
ncbi:adenylate/guanylate cyclase domain-containing protein [Flagellimonas meridianipacifica]|uniref:Adenylate cyclase n=1 Tax=Flagellimonas meridianipacifica TaxID=1080225 RepID=A0A2T0MFU8_9FLAO|nr:adenylate/guanylate cyclase domain-containing protein [Allomuricauda pacifica]PRX56443.1 adenylate cyclase [Allomuricauda pacifica]